MYNFQSISSRVLTQSLARTWLEHEAEAPVTMVTSGFSTALPRHYQAKKWVMLINIIQFIPLHTLLFSNDFRLWRLWLLWMMAVEYALSSCCDAEELMEELFGTVFESQRYGWCCCDSWELSQYVHVSQQPPEGDWRHSPHRLADKHRSLQLKAVNLKP